MFSSESYESNVWKDAGQFIVGLITNEKFPDTLRNPGESPSDIVVDKRIVESMAQRGLRPGRFQDFEEQISAGTASLICINSMDRIWALVTETVEGRHRVLDYIKVVRPKHHPGDANTVIANICVLPFVEKYMEAALQACRDKGKVPQVVIGGDSLHTISRNTSAPENIVYFCRYMPDVISPRCHHLWPPA